MSFKQGIKLIVTVSVILVVLAVALGAMIHFRIQTGYWFWDVPGGERPSEGINYYEADYEENIFENPRYMETVRDIYFGTEGTYYLLHGDEYEEAGTDAVFFRQFFDSVIAGDHEAYNSFFMDGYFTSKVRPKEEFTMQKIHNIHVMKKGTEEVTMDGEKYTAHTYVVKYMIMHNNGTFRLGIESDSYKPQLFRIVETDGEWKIHSILDIIAVYE